jgi:hypothetical protein
MRVTVNMSPTSQNEDVDKMMQIIEMLLSPRNLLYYRLG